MAHFAKVNEKTMIVEDIIVLSNIIINDLSFPESEPIGQAYILQLSEHNDRLVGKWYQTSYNTYDGKNDQCGIPIRGKYACIGDKFDPNLGTHGEFISNGK